MPQLLKPAHLEPMLRNKRSHCSEKPAHCNEEQPPRTVTRRKPTCSNKDPTQTKINLKIKYNKNIKKKKKMCHRKSEQRVRKRGHMLSTGRVGESHHGEGVSMSWVPSLNISGKGPGQLPWSDVALGPVNWGHRGRGNVTKK